ncbi:MAG: MFS transporter [Eisenbergiella massiliensis]
MSKLILDFNWLLGHLRRIYFMALPENEEDYEKSRGYYIAGDSATQTIAQLAGGTFLVSLMLSVNIPDATIGVITSMASFAALFQLFTMQKINRLKKEALCLSASSKTLPRPDILHPPHVPGKPRRTIPTHAGYFFAQACTQIGTPATQDWIATLVPMELRGRYFSRKDAIAVFVTVTTMLIAGVIMDKTAGPLQHIGFLINGSLILILVILNFWAFSCMKEPRHARLNAFGQEMHGHLARKNKEDAPARQKGVLKTEILEAFRNPDFRKAFWTNILWLTAFYTSSPFNTSYQIKDLSLPFTFIMVVGFFGNLIRIAITPMVGRMGDRYGMACIYKYSLVGILLNFAFMALSVPSNAYPMTIAATIFSAIGWSFAGIGLFGIQLELINEEKRTLQLSILSSIGGVYGFLVSFLAGRLLSHLQHTPLILAGRPLYAQQITNTLGVLFLTALILYTKFVVQKRETQLHP